MDTDFTNAVLPKIMGLVLIQEALSRWQIFESNYRSGNKIKQTI